MLSEGIYYGFGLDDNTVHDRHNEIIHCVLIGLLIFTASCATVTGILTEFDLSVNYPVIIIILLAASMYLALIHLSRLLYVAGYFGFLIVFAYSLLSMRSYANSGYQALLNIVNRAYSDHYLLSSVREYTEMISDRYETLTAVSIFIGVFLVLLLNVGIFNDMYFLTTFNLTFWPLQLGIFIGRYPSYISLALLFFSYFSVYFLRHSGHFFFVQPPRRKKTREYIFDYDDAMGRHMIFHKSNARSMAALCAFALAASLVFSVFCSLAVSTSEEEALINKSSVKAGFDERVKILTQTGIAGMFNRYRAKGGISGGRLGGVRSVAPDYETDLEVTFVPYSFETLYLHAFTGQQYTKDRWNPPSQRTGYLLNMPGSSGPSSESLIAADRILAQSRMLKELSDKGFIDEHTAAMTVKNVDADTSYVYVPYFLSAIPDKTLTDRYSTLSGFTAPGSEETYEFIPYFSDMLPLLSHSPAVSSGADNDALNEIQSEYEKEVYDNYLQIPENIMDELMGYHDRIGTAGDIPGQIGLIYDFLLKDYTYDMAPGATPERADFVTYFLGEQKRGYCAHFATAGTLLLRSYGIPARYAEGYVITTAGIAETGAVRDKDAGDYFTGPNPLGRSSVIKTDVTDGDAHAWTEVYISGFGWFPVDFTVPSTDDAQASYGDFLSVLRRLFSPSSDASGDNEDSDNDTTDTSESHHLFRLKSAPVFVVFIAVLLILLLIPEVIKIFRHFRRYLEFRKLYRAGNYAAAVAYPYSTASLRLNKRYSLPGSLSVNDCFLLIRRLLEENNRRASRLASAVGSAGMTLDELNMLTLSCFYSEKKISRSEADLLIKFYKSIR